MQPDIPLNHSPYTPLGARTNKGHEKKSRVLQQVPIIADCITYLSKQIDYYKSVESIPKEVMDSPEQFMHTVQAHKILLPILEKQKIYLQKQISAVESRPEDGK